MALNHTQAVLSAILNRLQELENAAWTLLQAMAIANATGDLLDKFGAIVGEPRTGRGDTDYRASIRLRVRTNISSGRALDIVAVAMLAYAPLLPNYLEGDVAAWTVDMPGVGSPYYVAKMLGRARAAGTYGCVHYSTASPVLFSDSVSGGVSSPGVSDSVSGGVATPGLSAGCFAV